MTQLLARHAGLSLILAAFVATPAGAQDTSQFDRNGGYFGLNGVVAVQDFDGTSGLGVDEESLGVGGRLGYRFHPYMAAELQFEWVKSYSVNPNGDAGGDIDRNTYLGGNFKGFLYPGRIQPYGMFGIGWQRAKFTPNDGSAIPSSKNDGLSFRYAAGADWYLTEKLGLSAEAAYVQGITSEVDDLSYFSFVWGFFIRL